MKRWLVLLLLVTPNLVVSSCGAPRRPANDEITIRLTAPEEEAPKRSGRPDASTSGVNDLRRAPSGEMAPLPSR